jgi:succinyl-CoA synthetase beta subunit
MLDFKKTKKILDDYKIPFVQSKLIKAKEEAFSFVKKSGYPVVLKSASPKIMHRTEKGAVITEIKDKEGLEEAYENLLKIEKVKEGEILVQKQLRGREVIIGAKIDPNFGPVVLFGLGGIFVEVYKDIAFRLAPIEREEAKKMIEEIKGTEILKEFRGKKPIDFATLENILVQTSKLIQKKKIKELDFNPVIANEKGCWVVDAKLVKSN